MKRRKNAKTMKTRKKMRRKKKKETKKDEGEEEAGQCEEEEEEERKEDDEEDKLFDSAVIISRLSLFQKKYDPEDFSMILIFVFIPWVLSSSMESLCILSRFFEVSQKVR